MNNSKNRVCKLLESRCSSSHVAETGSAYYTFKSFNSNVIIRVSDHLGNWNHKNNILTIIIPDNKATSYLVVKKKSKRVLAFNTFTELRQYLEAIFISFDMFTKIPSTVSNDKITALISPEEQNKSMMRDESNSILLDNFTEKQLKEIHNFLEQNSKKQKK